MMKAFNDKRLGHTSFISYVSLHMNVESYLNIDFETVSD